MNYLDSSGWSLPSWKVVQSYEGSGDTFYIFNVCNHRLLKPYFFVSSEISTLNMGTFIYKWKTLEWKSALTHHIYIKNEFTSNRCLYFNSIVLWIGSHHFHCKRQSFVNFIFILRGRCWVGERKIRFLLILFPKALLPQILLSFFRFASPAYMSYLMSSYS